MYKKLLCLTMMVFGCNGMTSKDSDQAWEKWGKEGKPLSLLEQWAKISEQPIVEKPLPKKELCDTNCGTVSAEEGGHFSPNRYIARLNGAQMVHDYPSKYKEHYMNMMVDIIVTFIEDLNAQQILDIEIMMEEILSLRTPKNAEAIDKVLEKIKHLKEE